MNTQAKIAPIALSIANISIHQDQEGRYCLNDLHKAAGDESRHQPSKFLETQQTKELIFELENYDTGNPVSKAVSVIRGKGKHQGTYAIKEIVYAYAMWVSAKFNIAVIRAYDALQNEISSELTSMNYKSMFEQMTSEASRMFQQLEVYEEILFSPSQINEIDRFLLTRNEEGTYIKKIGQDCFVMNQEKFISYLVKERGYTVKSKRELQEFFS